MTTASNVKDQISDSDTPFRAIVRGENRPDLLKHEVLADLFEETVNRTPNQVALIFQDDVLGKRTLTYKQLNQEAYLIAHHLIKDWVTR